jgi:hypothetical protein
MYCTELVCQVHTVQYFIPEMHTYTVFLSRCTTPVNNLDDGGYGHQSCDHTDMLVQELKLGVLWDKYGLVGDVVVCIVSYCLVSYSF